MSATESDPTPQPDDPTNSAKEANAEAGSPTESAENKASNASLEDQLAATVAERDDNRNKWLRTEAELDNYRKRVNREAEELRKYQSLPFAREFLPGLDNLQRALAAAETSKNVDDLVQGVSMVAKQFEDILSRSSIQAIDAIGEAFDPNLHEALQQLPSADYPAMTVIQELERGYTLHDRVVRPSKVIVSSGPPADAAPQE